LHVTDLQKNFGAVVAAADVNVTLYEQEVVAVIGANGAGKTTFVNMVTGYLKPSGGRIEFRGKNVSGQSPRAMSRIGICRSFQIAQLFPELSVLENMMLAFSVLKVGPASFFKPLHNPAAQQRAIEVLSDFGIAEHAHAQVNALAQGVRKLLDIALAMVSRPPLLLLDEPTSGVASEEKIELMDTVMSGVRHSNSAVLFIEHDMEIVSLYASRVIAFFNGRIIADAPTEQALKDPQVRQYVIGEPLDTVSAGDKHA